MFLNEHIFLKKVLSRSLTEASESLDNLQSLPIGPRQRRDATATGLLVSWAATVWTLQLASLGTGVREMMGEPENGIKVANSSIVIERGI